MKLSKLVNFTAPSSDWLLIKGMVDANIWVKPWIGNNWLNCYMIFKISNCFSKYIKIKIILGIFSHYLLGRTRRQSILPCCLIFLAVSFLSSVLLMSFRSPLDGPSFLSLIQTLWFLFVSADYQFSFWRTGLRIITHDYFFSVMYALNTKYLHTTSARTAGAKCAMPCVLVQAALTRSQRLGGSWVTEVYLSQSWGLQVWDQGASSMEFWWEPSSGLQTASVSLCPHVVESREEAKCLVSLIKTVILCMRNLPS